MTALPGLVILCLSQVLPPPQVLLHPVLLTRLTLGKVQSPRWRVWCNLCT